MNTLIHALHCSVAALAITLASASAGCSGRDGAPASSAARSVCDRGLLTARDVSGILRAPITDAQRIPSDPESCVFSTAEHSRLEVTLRPTGGKVTVDKWLAGTLALEAVPLHGVGDRAAWQRDLHEVIAERGDVLCDILVVGTNAELADSSEHVLETRLGRVCDHLLRPPP